MHKGKIVVKDGKTEIIDCELCGFKHLQPIPSKEEIKKYYEKQYYQDTKPNLLDYEKEIRETQWSNLWYKDKLDIVNNYIKYHSETKRLLDVGCGNGLFLRFMSENGWEANGIEPSFTASEIANSLNLNVKNKTLEDFIEDKWYRYFDFINLKCVLEHVPNPTEIINICKYLLKEEGIICIEVPNDFNILQLETHRLKLCKSRYWLAIPDHINYFDFSSLSQLLKKCGFDIHLQTTDFPMELFLLMEDNYVDNKEKGSKCHKRRMSFEVNISDEIRRDLYNSMAQLGIGRTCVIYATLNPHKQ
ncbi:class I SAM-dependent methyltransferase [Methanolobus profundi]|uniref:Methyltransferase domain-containing protein n=1 Tax=Methanolobus profundi TaxID=487685 RepID=A0A1I4UJ02_9EURY|nr:class I SAM-dependent methyltransferase [Methanolobus profundi]SFM88946.1 Methyltransferase domain-containing protein [Methanolobus profundi]